MDSKTLIIGRESTVNGWVTYESAVTESYERSVTEQREKKSTSRRLGLQFGAIGIIDRRLKSSASGSPGTRRQREPRAVA